jgi:hyperosmotically inducible periplasmic protein
MKPVVIALCVASLAGCDALSMSQKKQSEAKTVAAAPAQPAVPQVQVAKADPDKALAALVKQALETEPKIHSAGIDVTAAGGAVTLWGTAVSNGERARAARLASEVEGVKSVENRIAVVKGS